MTSPSIDLTLPPSLSKDRRDVLLDVARRNDAEHGADFLGLVLSGSVGRGVATHRSDVDVYVVLTDEGAQGRDTTRSTAVDEIPVALTELEEVPPFGSEGWWYRWSFAWAPVLLDRTDGRLDEALRRQATVTEVEAEEILINMTDWRAGSTTPTAPSRATATVGRSNDDWTQQSRSLGCSTRFSHWPVGSVRTTSTCPGKSENTHCPTGNPTSSWDSCRPRSMAIRQRSARPSHGSKEYVPPLTVPDRSPYSCRSSRAGATSWLSSGASSERRSRWSIYSAAFGQTSAHAADGERPGAVDSAVVVGGALRRWRTRNRARPSPVSSSPHPTSGGWPWPPTSRGSRASPGSTPSPTCAAT